MGTFVFDTGSDFLVVTSSLSHDSTYEQKRMGETCQSMAYDM